MRVVGEVQKRCGFKKSRADFKIIQDALEDQGTVVL